MFFHCAPAQLRLASRRSRSLPLLVSLATLIFTSVILRQTTINIGGDEDGVPPRSVRPAQRGIDEPLVFYGAARHLSGQRETQGAPPSGAQGATKDPAVIAGENTGHDPAQVTGHRPGGQVTNNDKDMAGSDSQAEVTIDDQSEVKGGNQTDSSEPGEKFLRWDRVVPAATAEQQVPLTSDWLWSRYQEQKERRETLAAACRRYNITLAEATDSSVDEVHGENTAEGLVETIKASHMSVVPKLKALVCLVNKVASTSLLGTMLKLAGHGVPVYSHDLASPHAHAKALQPEKSGELESARQKYTKVMLVRHPIDRLISAYEDKVKRAEHQSLQVLREAIFSTHEQIFILDKAVDLYSKNLDKKEEVTKAYYAELAAYREEVRRRKNVPTFQEFLDFVLSGDLTGDSFDSHWTPYWRQCAPCHMNYDVIGKLETGADDFKYVWNTLGIYRSVGIPWLHHQRRPPTALEQRLETYLVPLRADTIRQLRTMFRPDFDMFGYDWRRMLDVSGHCRPQRPCDLE